MGIPQHILFFHRHDCVTSIQCWFKLFIINENFIKLNNKISTPMGAAMLTQSVVKDIFSRSLYFVTRLFHMSNIDLHVLNHSMVNLQIYYL